MLSFNDTIELEQIWSSPKFVIKQRILVVDDEPLNLIALIHNLKMAMRDLKQDETLLLDSIDQTSYGQEAVDMFKEKLETENPYVLIFMDLQMEPVDGYTATRLIKQHCLEKEVDSPYIVACTGHSEE